MTRQTTDLQGVLETIEPKRTSSPSLLRSQVIFCAAICLILVTAVLLRWRGLNSESMWADEGYTTWFSQFSPSTQWRLLAWDTQAPSYHILLHYWVSFWGSSVTSFRALSALCSTLSVFVFFLVARKVWPDRVFLLLGLMLFSFSYFQIWYAKEARSYALLDLLLLTTVYCILEYLAQPTQLRLIGVAIALASTLYTHNMAQFYLPGFMAFWFLYPSTMTFRMRLKKASLVGVIVLALYIPWLPVLVKQIVSVHAYFWAPKPRVSDLLYSLFTFCGLDASVLQDLRQHLPIERFSGFRTLTMMLLAVLFACVAGAWWKVGSIDRWKSVSLQVLALSPIALVFMYSRISRSVYVDRNLIGACALMPIVLCAPIAVQRANMRKSFEIISVIVLCGSVASLSMRQQGKDDWRGVTQYLLKIPEQRRLVVVFQPFCQILVNYYATGLSEPYAKPEITGLIADLHQPPAGEGILPNLQTADPEAFLSAAMNTGKYKEIDVALQLERLPPRVQGISGFLSENCSSVQVVSFGNLGVSRCFTRQK